MQMRWLKCTLVWTFLLAACQVVVVGQTAPVGVAVQSALNEARAAYRQQDLPAAKRALAKVLTLDATQSEAFFLTAMIAVQEKNNGKALKSAKEAVRLQPRYPLAHYLLAQLYFAEGQRDDALLSIRQTLAQGAEFADAFVLLGDIELSLNRIAPALEAYEKALGQPAPQKSLDQEFELRLQALRNLMEFDAHAGEPGYEWPRRAGEEEIAASAKLARIYGNSSQVKLVGLGGVLTAQGITQVRVLGGAGKLAGPIYNKGYSIKDGTKSLTCTPAKKNGEVVPFWYRWEDIP